MIETGPQRTSLQTGLVWDKLEKILFSECHDTKEKNVQNICHRRLMNDEFPWEMELSEICV